MKVIINNDNMPNQVTNINDLVDNTIYTVTYKGRGSLAMFRRYGVVKHTLFYLRGGYDYAGAILTDELYSIVPFTGSVTLENDN